MYTFKFEATENNIKAILLTDYESFTVGNRAFKTELQAVEYCNTCDFDYSMIVMA